MSKTPDCPQPENVVCPIGENGFKEYKELILASQDSLAQQMGELRKENKDDHDKIFLQIHSHERLASDRMTQIEVKASGFRGRIVGWSAGVAAVISVAIWIVSLVVGQ